MEFEELDPASRSKIWSQFIRRVDRDLLDEIPEWSQDNLNARQIRNIVLSAESLAIAKGRSGGKPVAKDINDIKRYVMKTELKDQTASSKLVSSMLHW